MALSECCQKTAEETREACASQFLNQRTELVTIIRSTPLDATPLADELAAARLVIERNGQLVTHEARAEAAEASVKTLTEERDKALAFNEQLQNDVDSITLKRTARLTEERDAASLESQIRMEHLIRVTSERDAARAETQRLRELNTTRFNANLAKTREADRLREALTVLAQSEAFRGSEWVRRKGFVKFVDAALTNASEPAPAKLGGYCGLCGGGGSSEMVPWSGCQRCQGKGIPTSEPAPREMPGTHNRPDGKQCAYLAHGFCNKCGWVEPSEPAPCASCVRLREALGVVKTSRGGVLANNPLQSVAEFAARALAAASEEPR